MSDGEYTRDRLARARAEFNLCGVSEADVRPMVRAALHRTPQFRVLREASAEIVLKRRMNWATWGEVLTLTWYPMSEGVHVDLVVKPLLRTTVHDWGQGLRDVAAIRESLIAEAGSADARP